MVDHAYQAGLDWDTYRIQTPMQEIVIPQDHVSEERVKNMSLGAIFALILCGITLTLLFSYYVLLNVPYFDIQQVTYQSNFSQPLPPSILEQYQADVVDTSIFSFAGRKTENLLLSHPLVKEVVVKRAKGHKLNVVVETYTPTLLMVDKSSEGGLSYWGAIETGFVQIEKRDFDFYQGSAMTLTVNSIDDDQLTLINQLLTEDKKFSSQELETMLSPMVISLPSMAAEIRIKEEISYARLHYVVQLITLEYEKNHLTNIALNSKVRYDLYQDTLFKEQIFGGNN